MTDDGFESRILRFEQTWQRSGPSDIADYLKQPSVLAPQARLSLLVELICIDMEYRWQDRRSSGPATLESYLARFRELGALDELPLELIGEEYRVRHRWGDQPTHAELLSRFGANRELIRPHLVRIDEELKRETADLPTVSAPAKRLSPTAAQVEQHSSVPLLSHRDVILRRMIGEGSMGKVYRASQPSTGHEVAVKFLRKSLLQDPRVVQRFIVEAETIAKLRHPNIVGVHGYGRTDADAYFIVMDLVKGPNLARLRTTHFVTVAEAIAWTIELCNALEHAHAKGIIHCDLKPANLLLGDDGRIRVTDFGLARSLTEQTPWIAEVEGTAPFMAPEQASSCWGDIDQRTDVYGIGAVFYTLLTGRPPWVGRRLPDVLANVISAAPVMPAVALRPELPELISELCGRCLSKAPAARYQTVQDVRSALTELARTV